LDPLIKSQLLYQLSYTPVAIGEMGGVAAVRKRASDVASGPSPVHPLAAMDACHAAVRVAR
jgi:hypothetical protein